MTISKWTLENLFPHLGKLGRHVERNSVKDTVAEKLVDQRIVVDGRTMFYWDCGTEAIASVMVDNDFLTPILELLGSLEEVSEVFEHALVSPNLQWRSIS
ncbi:hypothetical protein GN244_ATG18829 [Phytophthora infestans]|uniref:Uncharacterized protein n=1 Tax=Phytophthora infestans TaxID=4787 RepID=A0A833WJM7_PHYIN|nr:hypothetical protein GN244_ATG18829 [Phytophthora infestans]KAF4138580.1 hypothetical protein GN958_ATG12228 [Phytophthora infestans]